MFYGIGLGPGDPELVTIKAAKALESVDRIFAVRGPKTQKSVSESIVESVLGATKKLETLFFSMDKDKSEQQKCWVQNARHIYESIKKGENVSLTFFFFY